MPGSAERAVFAEISPSEFFYRNRDLAGFSNPARALYSAVRELVENSLDACEDAKIQPEIMARILPADGDASRPDPQPYYLRVQDNGSGIEPRFIPQAFGRVFYGSKFRLRQARGMFGMGGTMAILYGQITTNEPVTVISSSDGITAHTYRLMIDIQRNAPIVLERNSRPAEGWRGTSVEICLEGDYSRAGPRILEYFRQTALVTPYANLTFIDPQGRLLHFRRATERMPAPPLETLPHPHGIDAEALRRMVRRSDDTTLLKFLCNNFHRVGERIAKRFLEYAGLAPDMRIKELERDNERILALLRALHSFDGFLSPDASCLSPLGEELLIAGIKKELQPEFIAVCCRPPSAYSGYPFIVEVGLAYGGKVLSPGLKLLRFANRIPLLYDEANDVAWKVIREEIDLRRYKVPSDAPLAILTHVCSTKVPYKTVGKEYLADRPELERELKNAIREVLRKLQAFLARKGTLEVARRRMNIYSRYLPLVARFSMELAKAPRPPRYRKLLQKPLQRIGLVDEGSQGEGERMERDEGEGEELALEGVRASGAAERMVGIDEGEGEEGEEDMVNELQARAKEEVGEGLVERQATLEEFG